MMNQKSPNGASGKKRKVNVEVESPEVNQEKVVNPEVERPAFEEPNIDYPDSDEQYFVDPAKALLKEQISESNNAQGLLTVKLDRIEILLEKITSRLEAMEEKEIQDANTKNLTERMTGIENILEKIMARLDTTEEKSNKANKDIFESVTALLANNRKIESSVAILDNRMSQNEQVNKDIFESATALLCNNSKMETMETVTMVDDKLETIETGLNQREQEFKVFNVPPVQILNDYEAPGISVQSGEVLGLLDDVSKLMDESTYLVKVGNNAKIGFVPRLGCKLVENNAIEQSRDDMSSLLKHNGTIEASQANLASTLDDIEKSVKKVNKELSSKLNMLLERTKKMEAFQELMMRQQETFEETKQAIIRYRLTIERLESIYNEFKKQALKNTRTYEFKVFNVPPVQMLNDYEAPGISVQSGEVLGLLDDVSKLMDESTYLVKVGNNEKIGFVPRLNCKLVENNMEVKVPT